jgi:hypothetical protein
VPEVNIMERTPSLRNSSIASPGLKHHQLRVLEDLPGVQEYCYSVAEETK